MHFLWEQFQHRKMLPQRDFTAGGFPLAGAWNVATTPGTTAEGQVPGNDLPIPANLAGELSGHQQQGGDFSQPALRQWFSVSLPPLWKALSTHNRSLRFLQPIGLPGDLSGTSPPENVVHSSPWRL